MLEQFLLVNGPWHGRHILLAQGSTQLKLILDEGTVFYVYSGYGGRLEYQPFPH